MREFFRGWRRKIGVVPLALACVFAMGWVRSRSEDDSINFELYNGTWNYLGSNGGNLTWMTSTSEIDGLTAYEAAMAVGLPPDERQAVSSNAFSETTKDSRLKTTKYVVPYWSIVVPLTALSAGLLLWKPRHKKTAEPIPETGA
jgi:hypothetical protein